MRLICPGCGAQYEVDEGVIPDAGRDVQCSACGHVWFQKSRPILLSEDAAVTLPEDDWEPDGTQDMQPRPTLGASALLERINAEDRVAPAPTAGAVPRKPLDDSLLAILREEAEREVQARRAENLESQEEMVLMPAAAEPVRPQTNRGATVALSLRRVFAAESPLVPAPAAETPAPVVAPEPEPEVLPEPEPEIVSLPDIGEINSSLRASADRVGEPAALDTPQVLDQRRSGFRTGFVSVMLVAALATAGYGFAPRIGAAVPSLDPVLDGYVSRVDAGRIWLDHTLRAAISQVQTALK